MNEMSEVGERAAACCGGPAPNADACCVNDAEAKAAGEPGCGCAAPETGTKAAAGARRSCCD
jgi:hypothetical protein